MSYMATFATVIASYMHPRENPTTTAQLVVLLFAQVLAICCAGVLLSFGKRLVAATLSPSRGGTDRVS